MENVDATSLCGAIWWPNAGKVIEVPNEGEAVAMCADWLKTPRKLLSWTRLVNQLERALLDRVARKGSFVEQTIEKTEW